MCAVSLDETISARTTRFVETTLAAEAHVVQAHLAGQRIVIELDSEVGETFAGQMILFTLLNLLIRLERYCPHLDVVASDVERHPLVRLLEPGSLLRALETFFAPFPASQRLHVAALGSGEGPAAHVVIGPQPVKGALSVWADGWITYLNVPAPLHPNVANSVGACVTADFAAAEVFKSLIAGLPLRPGLAIRRIDRLVFSAYDYGLAAGPNPPLPTMLNVEGVIVVGLGGIGAGFVVAAAGLPDLAGSLTLVDKDALDNTNLNRLLYARPGDAGPKVDLARRALACHADVEPREEWFDEFTASAGTRHDLVVVGVDEDPVRRTIQASMPRLILNGGTSDTASLQVTRHDYLHGACLACLATGDSPRDHPREREVARQLGFDLETVLRYQASGDPIPTELLRTAGVLIEPDVIRLGGRPLAEIQVAICGQLPLGIGRQQEAVSISFLSAMPGFLLLGEVIKERGYQGVERPPLNAQINRMLLALLGRPHAELLHGQATKRASCDCRRDAYQRNYRRKWLGDPTDN
jgi:molybdopterin/thiamine biosynthesis adenylyltransferase